MITWFLAVALAAPVRFDRVDLVSETTASWQHDELPRLGQTPRVVAMRWAEQVQPVIAVPLGVDAGALQLGASLRAQSIRYERAAFRPSWSVNAGVQLGAGLPNGALAGLSWRHGALRVGGSLAAVSAASWARPVWDTWRWLPAVGIGVGPAIPERAPWMW